MKSLDSTLVTPVYLKMSPQDPWPEDKVFYMLTRSGLFLCRNHEFFQSCVPAGRWPTELDDQRSFHRIRYPRLPRRLLEQVVAFFDCVWTMHGGEAVVALAWNQNKQKVQVVVPEQQTIVSSGSWGNRFPIGVKYQLQSDLPTELSVYGDFHSHCGMDAYTSQTDADDEFDRSGLHVVVGRLNREPPQFHVEAVVDGTRFRVATHLVLEKYRQRDWKFPKAWLDKVRVDPPKNSYRTYSSSASSSSGYGKTYKSDDAGETNDDYVARQYDDDRHDDDRHDDRRLGGDDNDRHDDRRQDDERLRGDDNDRHGDDHRQDDGFEDRDDEHAPDETGENQCDIHLRDETRSGVDSGRAHDRTIDSDCDRSWNGKSSVKHSTNKPPPGERSSKEPATSGPPSNKHRAGAKSPGGPACHVPQDKDTAAPAAGNQSAADRGEDSLIGETERRQTGRRDERHDDDDRKD